MPFDIVAWAEAAPGTGTVYLAAGLGDSFYRTTGDDIFIRPEAPYCLGVLSMTTSTGGTARLRQPSLAIDYEFIKSGLTTDLDPMLGYHHMFGRPLPMIANEKCNALVTNATDEDNIVAAIFGSGKITQSALDGVNPTHRITGYSDTTVTALTWSNCPITWNQDLPEGRYAVVGLRVGVYVASRETAVARLTGLKGPGSNWRPGVPCALMDADHEEFQDIGWEPYVRWPLMPEISFPHDDLPDVEVLMVNTAATDENVELLLQKIS
ncbi:MAG: hypothetical protein ACFFCO_12275 [Promethearchaeota archaeon]